MNHNNKAMYKLRENVTKKSGQDAQAALLCARLIFIKM